MEEKSVEIKNRASNLSDDEIISAIESILFISADPVFFDELSRVFAVGKTKLQKLFSDAEKRYNEEGRGVTLIVTDETVQMVSNKIYDDFVVEFLQPAQMKNFSQSMLETLTIVAYRQPITRSEIDQIRGIRSEYSVTQLIKQGFIADCGRKDCIGKPVLFCTTDKFLRKFGLHNLSELPDFESFSTLPLIEADDEQDMKQEPLC